MLLVSKSILRTDSGSRIVVHISRLHPDGGQHCVSLAQFYDLSLLISTRRWLGDPITSRTCNLGCSLVAFSDRVASSSHQGGS